MGDLNSLGGPSEIRLIANFVEFFAFQVREHVNAAKRFLDQFEQFGSKLSVGEAFFRQPKSERTHAASCPAVILMSGVSVTYYGRLRGDSRALTVNCSANEFN